MNFTYTKCNNKFHHGGQSMSIAAVSSATTNPVSLTKTASDGDSPAVEAAESKKTKAAELANGGTAPKAAPSAAGKSSSSTQNLARIKMLASQHMSASQIAGQLGISVSTVQQEAAAAGINLNAGQTSDSSPAATGNPAIGNNINVKA
jgi:hypothetical protein